jgi:hypothetical protein
MPTGLTDILRELKDVRPGDDVADVACAQRMNAMMEGIPCLARETTSTPGLHSEEDSGWICYAFRFTGWATRRREEQLIFLSGSR